MYCAALLSVLDYLMVVTEILRIDIIYRHQAPAFLTSEGWKSQAPRLQVWRGCVSVSKTLPAVSTGRLKRTSEFEFN